MTDEQPRGLTQQQVNVLLYPLARDRVHRDPGGNSYLPQQDVRAHLTRVFGFGNWSSHVVEVEKVYEAPTLRVDRKLGKRNPDRIDCLWRATVRLDVRDQYGNHLATYEDAATGDAQNSEPLAAHDLALKSAVSTALKRAATSLGDQFGLSLYNKGSLDAFVGQTLVGVVDPHAVDLSDVPAATEEQDPDRRPQVDDDGTVAVPQPAYDGSHGDPTDAPPPLPERRQAMPEEVAEAAVERRQRERATRDSGRRGPDTDKARARLWDAVTEWAGAGADQATRTVELNAECARRGWNMPGQLHPDRLVELAVYYEEKADDAIRARIARGE